MATRSTTLTSTPRLSEYARKFTYPAGIKRTVWPRVEAKGAELGLGFDWWQSQLGTVVLGYGDDGKYVATIGGIGMSIPRQVGKTYFVLSLLVVLCILFPGLQVVWTAHHLRTSTKTFTALRGICRRKKVAPHVRALRAANGEQQVEFVNGSMIMFGARSRGFGRGFDEIDVEVFDEAQILDTKSLEDMVAATNQARHEHGALLFFMGTPPRDTDPSEAFRTRRAEAWAGEAEDAIWLELGADPESDPNDESQWPVMNPSYPLRTPRESLQRLRKNLKDDDSWNREGRGIWDPKSSPSVIEVDDWLAMVDKESRPTDPVSFAVDISPDRKRATICVAAYRPDGMVHVEIVPAGEDGRPDLSGTGWIVPRLSGLVKRQSPCAVVLDPGANTGSLLPDLAAEDVETLNVNSTQYAQACGAFYDLVAEGKIRHRGDPRLTTAIDAGRKRPSREAGAWMWNRKDTAADITPLVAATLAVHGLQVNGRKKPKSKAAYGF